VPRGVPGNVPPSGNAQGRAELARTMRNLAEVEAWPIYAELVDEADRRVRTNGGRVADHGWGEYGANGDVRKRRKAASA
jgi:hypothetical protein